MGTMSCKSASVVADPPARLVLAKAIKDTAGSRPKFRQRSATPRDARAATWRDAYNQGQAEWPRIKLSYQVFAAHVTGPNHGETVPPNAADLYLAVACGLHLPGACEALEAVYVQPLRPVLRGMLNRHDAVEDALQELRTRLLVGPTPKISVYRGDGGLRNWVR